MRPIASRLLLAWAVSALAPAAAEPSLDLSVTDKLDYRRFDGGSRREEAFRNRLEVDAASGAVSVWLRLESLQVSDANAYDPYGAAGTIPGEGEERIDRTEVTRRALTVRGERIRAVVGDYSYVFGRGLALSVFEDEELNYDTRLEGLLAEVDGDRGRAVLLAGSRDGDRFRGLFVEPVAWGALRVGGSFVEAWGSGERTEVLDREQHWGGLAEIRLGPAALYGEYVLRDFAGRKGRGALGTPGHGGFVSAVATIAGVTVSGEFRDMFRFEHAYNDPPTTLKQHTWTLLNRAVGQAIQDIPDDDVKGYLAEVEWAPGLFTVLSGSFGRIDADRSDDVFWETYGEARTTWRERLFATAAAAESEFRIATIFEERISGFGELVLELDGRNSVALGTEWSQARVSDALTQRFEFPEEFRERILSISYGRSPRLQITATYEDTTREDPSREREEWFSVLAEIALADGHDVNLSYGSERGGWKCTGGVCFFEPEFEGFKLEWVGRY